MTEIQYIRRQLVDSDDFQLQTLGHMLSDADLIKLADAFEKAPSHSKADVISTLKALESESSEGFVNP